MTHLFIRELDVEDVPFSLGIAVGSQGAFVGDPHLGDPVVLVGAERLQRLHSFGDSAQHRGR